MKHFSIPLSKVRELEDEEFIELAAASLWLEERQVKIIKAGVNQAITAAFNEKKG